MEFLKMLEQIRLPGLNELMMAITMLGDEVFFLAITLIVFWCVDKKKGYYLMSVGLTGTLANQLMKLSFRIPRPWVRDPSFTIVEQARESAGGYSFPSGHTQCSVGTFGSIALTTERRWARWLCVVLAVLVPFSRMYLGVHTPQDVLVAAAMAIVLLLVFRPLMLGHDGKYIPWVLGAMAVLAAGFLLYVELFPFPEDIDIYNLNSGRKNAYTLMGTSLGLIVVYLVDSKWLHFPVRAIWWAQLLKLFGGLAVVLAVKVCLSNPLTALFGQYPGRLIRYFLIVIVAGCLWPMTFRFFGKLGSKEKQ